MVKYSYYLPDTYDNFITRAYHKYIKHEMPVPPFPSEVQIQTESGCNARCIFCPSGKTHNQIPKTKMSFELFKKIVDECCDNGVQRISPYLMCEPFIDKDIPDYIAYVTKRKQKGTYTKVNSNGALLTEDMAKRVLDSGLDRLNFSVHGIVPEIYEETMVGLKLPVVLKNIDRFLELKRDGNYKKPRVRVTMVKTKLLEPQLPDILKYWGERDIQVNIQALENRANDKVDERQLFVKKWKPFTWCKRMFMQGYILSTGKMILCCVDWDRTTVLGDLNRNTIKEVWNNDAYRAVRRQFLSKDLKGLLCASCKKE